MSENHICELQYHIKTRPLLVLQWHQSLHCESFRLDKWHSERFWRWSKQYNNGWLDLHKSPTFWLYLEGIIKSHLISNTYIAPPVLYVPPSAPLWIFFCYPLCASPLFKRWELLATGEPVGRYGNREPQRQHLSRFFLLLQATERLRPSREREREKCTADKHSNQISRYVCVCDWVCVCLSRQK